MSQIMQHVLISILKSAIKNNATANSGRTKDLTLIEFRKRDRILDGSLLKRIRR
jgi:hypothetical protein